MKKTLLALALLATTAVQAEQGDITVHTVTAHVGVSGLNNFNPGLAYDFTDIFRAGAFYNSYRKPSVYLAGQVYAKGRLTVAVGVISGYGWDSETGALEGRTTAVLPLLAAEFRITRHVAVAWFGQAFNLELKF